MKWDNGRSLSLMPFEDSFTVIQNEQQATPDEQLYEKLCQEQAAFRDELLALPPEQILDIFPTMARLLSGTPRWSGSPMLPNHLWEVGKMKKMRYEAVLPLETAV